MINKVKYFSLILAFAFFSCSQAPKESANENTGKDTVPGFEELKWSEKMAASIMKENPEAWQIDGKKEAKWDYVHGLVLLSFQKLYEKTSDEKYYTYVKNYVDALIDSSGAIATYKFEDYNIDMVNAGKLLFDL